MVKISRLVLPGGFVEAFVYFDSLWLVGADGDVWAFDIERYLRSTFGTNANTAAKIFARNNEISTNPRAFHKFADLPQILRDFVDDHPSIEVSSADFEKYSWIFNTRLEFKSVIDMRCYYGRAFVATDDTIFQIGVHGRDDLTHVGVGRRANGHLRQHKVHDGRCFQIKCKYGVVNASCGRDGGLYAANAEDDASSWRAQFARFADRSVATEFVADGVANLPAASDFELFEADRRPLLDQLPASLMTSGEEIEDDHAIRSIVGQNVEMSQRTRETVARVRASGGIARLFLSTKSAFAVDQQNSVHRVELASSDGEFYPRVRTTFPAAPGSVLAMAPSALGMIAELDESVVLLSRGRWVSLYEGAVYSFRGYPSSRRYRNLVTIVGADRVELLFIS